MIFGLNDTLILSSIIVLISVLISKSSNKFGLPILVIFLGIGMLAGSEGLIGIEYENYELTHSFSLVAICLIIFSGGLLTKFEDIRPNIGAGISLSTLGVFLTTGLVGLFCHFFLTLPLIESLLIGSILSSTDAAAVFTAFRDKNAQVTKNVKSILEFESGSNDPMAYLLVTIFLGFYQNKIIFNLKFIEMIVTNPIVGIIGGVLFFKLFKFVNDSIKLDFQGLYPALTIGFLFLTYSLTTKLNGNGFLAVYIFAVKLGNAKIIHKNALVAFFDGIAWLAQIGLFITLGLLVFPSRLIEVAPQAIIVSVFLIFIARPISVIISTVFSKTDFKSKLFISWAGLKGATPIVFASFIATEVGSEANLIFDIVFFSVLISAILQGTTIRPLAKKLHLLFEAVQDPEFPVDIDILSKTKHGIKEILINDDDFAVSKRIIDLKLPDGTVVLFIKRDGSFIIPNGSTQILVKDKILFATSEKDQIEETIKSFQKEKIIDNILDFPDLSQGSEEISNEHEIELKSSA